VTNIHKLIFCMARGLAWASYGFCRSGFCGPTGSISRSARVFLSGLRAKPTLPPLWLSKYKENSH